MPAGVCRLPPLPMRAVMLRLAGQLCVLIVTFETDRSAAARRSRPSIGTCARWLLKLCQLFAATRGIFASSLMFVTWYSHWFQTRRELRQLPFVSLNTNKPARAGALAP